MAKDIYTPYHARQALDLLGATMDAESNENLLAAAQVQATLAVADAISLLTKTITAIADNTKEN